MLQRPQSLIGHRRAHRRRRPHLKATYVLAGPLRWVEPDGRRAMLRVDAANPAGRRFCGHTVALELDGVAPTSLDPGSDRLTAGEIVTARVRLPKHLGPLPTAIQPRSVVIIGPPA